MCTAPMSIQSKVTAAPELMLMIEAYLRLLKVPHACESRTRLQTALATLRDEIARVSGWSGEAVQNTCERVVGLLDARKC